MGPSFLLLRGTPRGPAYVRRAVGNSGMVAWSHRRSDALRLDSVGEAHALQEAAAIRYGIAVAVVPAVPDRVWVPR